ncbi:Vps16, region, partial [Dictyocaulus viviparus]
VNIPTLITASKEPPSAWTVLQPRSQLTQVIVAYGTTFYSGCQGEQLVLIDTPFAESDGQYARMVVSSDHSFIALYHSSRLIQITSVDLSKQISRISVPGDQSIYRFGWVGLNAVFLQRTPTHIQLFNVRDEAAHYDLHMEFVQIGVENDGIKLYTNTGMEFLCPVSPEEQAVLGVASTSDGALLYEAAQWLDSNKSHKSYEYAMQISDISLAISQCISAAFSTWSPKMQKTLLKASHFGRAFSTGFDTNSFVRVLRELRVLNEIHRERIGIPITEAQFKELGESCLINRLIDIEAYGLAAEICSWLGREPQEGIDRVLLEWVRRSINKVASLRNAHELNMEALDEKIARKLLCYPHVSLAENKYFANFKDAAKRAIDAKLPKLARLLIKREKDDSKQVHVLLQLGDVQEALSKAAAAQRPQLMHQVIRHLMKEQKRAEYELAIRKIPLAQCLYQDLVRRDNERASGRMMLALLEQASDFERQIMFHLDSVENGMNPNERLDSLRRAKEAARNMGDKGVEELLIDVAAFAPCQLERHQEHMTIRETVIEYAGDPQKVAQLKHQAKLSEKQLVEESLFIVYLWTIEGLAKMGKMEQLFDMAQKRSPVGYVPFIKACIKYNRREEGKKYFAKVSGYQDLVAAYLALGNFVGAAKMAFDRRDRDTLQHIFMKSHSNKEAYSKVGQLVKSL